ncbi:NADH-quinone oxidoreductase subunit NuoK [Planctomicrobium sp. SH668]|uniref:NADH-quinone oxidoreductase subunit NuoK n=1 Tax=Planctomicrobium sp. SH668 TaxID=3448126 RepID=UPI003F5C4026
MTGDLNRYLAVGAALFVLGAIGFLTRRNLIMIVLSSELMLHGISLSLLTFGRMHNTLEGQAFTVFVLTVAASEAGLALALILALYRQNHSLDIDLWSSIREADVAPPTPDSPSLTPSAPAESFPTLAPAGRAPVLSEGDKALGDTGPSGPLSSRPKNIRSASDATK